MRTVASVRTNQQPRVCTFACVPCTPRIVSGTAGQAEDDRKARERDERRRQDRLKREDFKEFLQGMVEENAITADTTWKDLKRSIEEEDAYKAMEGQPGGARDVFDDIVADLRRQVELQTSSSRTC